MLVSGRGELLEPIEVPALEGISVKIETPNVFISTAEAYRGVVPEKPQIPLRELLKLPLDEWRYKIKNDFEKTLFAKYPQLDECKENFYRKGAVYASMSGSGSSVFGLFAK
jgi:4-diphosphocytidyl-2-C-methyl-D-erythritol kinase